MTPTTEVLPERKTENSAVALIREAMAGGASPEYLRELLAVKKEWQADEARMAYFRSVALFQADCPIIEKADKAHDKMYARLDRIMRTIRPLLAKYELSVTWQRCEFKDGMCRVEGTLAHASGHSTPIVQEIPLPELIRGQNQAQQMGSAKTYAERYALTGCLGIVTGEDDDGNKAGTRFVTTEQELELAEMIDACRGVAGFNEPKFWEWVGGGTAADIPAAMYDRAKAALKKRLGGAA